MSTGSTQAKSQERTEAHRHVAQCKTVKMSSRSGTVRMNSKGPDPIVQNETAGRAITARGIPSGSESSARPRAVHCVHVHRERNRAEAVNGKRNHKEARRGSESRTSRTSRVGANRQRRSRQECPADQPTFNRGCRWEREASAQPEAPRRSPRITITMTGSRQAGAFSDES